MLRQKPPTLSQYFKRLNRNGEDYTYSICFTSVLLVHCCIELSQAQDCWDKLSNIIMSNVNFTNCKMLP